MEIANAQSKDCGDGGDDSRMGYGPTQRKRMKSPPAPAQISPLLINHVLEQIFQGASIPDLISYRMVCREWNNAATKSLQGQLDFITIGCRNVGHVHSLHYENLTICSSLPQQSSSSSPPVLSSSASISSSSSPSSNSSASGLSSLVSPLATLEHLERFLRVILSSTNPPFTKYEIVSSFFMPENETIISRFFKLSAPFIQALKISLDNRAPGEFSPGFLSHVQFPKLRSVVFEVLRQFTLSEESEDDPTTPDNLELRDNAVSYKMLSRITFGATSLESLEVSLQRKCDGEGQRRFNNDGTPNFERDRRAGLGGGGTCPCQHFTPPNEEAGMMFPTLSNSDIISISNNLSTPSSSPLKLTEVNCHLPLPVGDKTSPPPRISNSPKLKRLHLRLRNSFIHQNCITSLLHRLASTLEELSFSEEGHGSRVVVEFPRMKRLQKLNLSAICEFEQNFVTVLPLNYSEQLPRLTTLNLWDCFGTEKRYEQLFFSGTVSHSLTKLVFPSQFRNVAAAQNIPQIFPNLKSLTMVFSTRTENLAVIETVFQSYGESLEEFHLITDMNIQNQNVDHVLTGLPTEICRKMRLEESFVMPMHLQGMARKASLVDLKRLKRLIFQLEHKYSRAPLITDVTGYLAFINMPNLEYLRFTRYGMSWKCCEALAKKCRVELLPPNGNNVFEIETFDFDFEGI